MQINNLSPSSKSLGIWANRFAIVVRSVILFSSGIVGMTLSGFAKLLSGDFIVSDNTVKAIFRQNLAGGAPTVSHEGAPYAGTTGVTIDQQILETYGKIPLSFEANHGQTNEQVNFLARGSGYTLFLTPSEAVLSLVKPIVQETSDLGDTLDTEVTVLRMQIVDANPTTKVMGLDELPGKSNYFIGKDPQNWRTDISNYARVQYQDIYPGVDLIYYGNQRQLEYDFVVKAGADPNNILLGFEGADKLTLDTEGNLILHTTGGKVIQHAPVIYQEINGDKQVIPGQYILKGNDKVGFQVGAYDRSMPLVIDPVLGYSTFLGGSNTELGFGIAVDSAGNAYVTGRTDSPNFPTVNPIQPTLGGISDAFVTKLNAAGSALVYSTFLGGSNFERGSGIAVDSAGNAYVTGRTESPNFPTVNPIQPTLGGAADAFVTKISEPSPNADHPSILSEVQNIEEKLDGV